MSFRARLKAPRLCNTENSRVLLFQFVSEWVRFSFETDGKATNTENKSEVTCRLENLLHRPVHWFICQLHINELSLTHLTEEIDGKISAPAGFTDSTGERERLGNAHTTHSTISSNWSRLSRKWCLWSKPRSIHMICRAIFTGECSPDIDATIPEPVNLARWLMTESRIRRHYV